MATSNPKRRSSGKFVKPQSIRLWLMFPPKLIQKPVVWELGHKFEVVTNVRQASVTDEIGIVCLEIEGAPAEVEAGVKWLKRVGVKVEPVELNAMES
jgi:L-aspartate semialdehyde sulfurtransferase ferredoxin